MPPSQIEDPTADFGPESPPPRPVPVEPGPERRLGGYELCYELDSGGMATIYLARQDTGDGLGKPVAIKRLLSHLVGTKDMEDMFLDEARIASKIRHPNVCSVLEVGQADGSTFIVMEYLAGVTMSRLIRAVARRPKTLASARWHALAARVVSDAASGLHAAHELSEDGQALEVVHRDVSPSNVFCTFDGNSKILDFGVAAARNRIRVTREIEVKGKLGYVSPEQVESKGVDRRADIWGLGVCLWEALAGRRLFKHHTVLEHLALGVMEPLPLPSEVVPEVPKALDQVVARCLAWEREDRYPTARHMAADLFRFVRSANEPAGPQQLASLLLELFRVVHSQDKDVLLTMTDDGAGVPRTNAMGRLGKTHPGSVRARGWPGPRLPPAEPSQEVTETVQLPPMELSGTNWLEFFETTDDGQTETTPVSDFRGRPRPPKPPPPAKRRRKT